MANTSIPEYVLTIVQHTHCRDCFWLKSKITDVYHASGMDRGEQDSQHWRVQIISPPWDRQQRLLDFPRGFQTVEVPALKLEVDRKLILATQNPTLIKELLAKLKWLLINRHTNVQIECQLAQMAEEWVETPADKACVVERGATGELRLADLRTR